MKKKIGDIIRTPGDRLSFIFNKANIKRYKDLVDLLADKYGDSCSIDESRISKYIHDKVIPNKKTLEMILSVLPGDIQKEYTAAWILESLDDEINRFDTITNKIDAINIINCGYYHIEFDTDIQNMTARDFLEALKNDSITFSVPGYGQISYRELYFLFDSLYQYSQNLFEAFFHKMEIEEN